MELNFKTYGEGSPVIVLHGLFGMLDNWQSIAKALKEEDLQIILVDLPNHGRSPHVDTFDYPSMADAVLEFCIRQDIHYPQIIGHSMGGKVALQLATAFGSFPSSLCIVDMGMRQYRPHHTTILDALRTLSLDSVQKRSDAEAHLEQSIDDQGVRLFLMKNLTRQKEGGFRWKMNLPVIVDHYDSILASIEPDYPIDVPTLFIRGEKSNYIRDEDWNAIEAQFEETRLETVTDAGHWVHAEQPEALLQLLKPWLALHAH